MANGTIRRLVKNRGFGFIKSTEGKDYFFHRSQVVGVSLDLLEEGQSVEFEKGDSPKGPKEVNIKLIRKAN